VTPKVPSDRQVLKTLLPAGADYGEDALVEQPALDLLGSLGWEVANLYNEWSGATSREGRETMQQAILAHRLRAALARLNPGLPDNALAQAVEELTRDRSRLVAVNANQELHRLLRDGVRVAVPDKHGCENVETVRIIDWRAPGNNDFLAASQFRIKGDLHKRRADIVCFVNGLPLILFELKASHRNLQAAFDGNLRDYLDTVPQLFTPNAFVVLSNGSKTKMGSSFAGWEHFFEWKRINDEKEKGVVSLDRLIRGVCAKDRLLDIVENFIVYEESKAGLVKKVAKNHQYLGVNNAVEAVLNVRNRPENEAGRLGVFWHTQGSGKSLSMIFFSRKILRTLAGDWTFVVVTDRKELDEQIYKNFAATGTVTEAEAHAVSGDHLKQLLTQNHRFVFTLIQKFRNDGKLSDRRDIIVITDEAHRTQYDLLAMNMRNALPRACFLGFTGTPLIAGEERTKEVFGDYVSIYDVARSAEDGATVPLYYENRIPELQLTNDNLQENLEELLEAAEMDEEQERKVEREFSREYHLITREDRLEAIAEDLVLHFIGRGHRGKAMMICIDKATAVCMYNKVRAHWADHLASLKTSLPKAPEEEREMLESRIEEMEKLDMAVVVSQGQNEVADLAAKGLDIRSHRRRMIREDLDEKFKDPADPLRLVFLCAMWTTGFDAPSCSTIYLDKPMRNHTLMQTITRANRCFEGKEAGLVVDYVGVFRNLQKALAIYGGVQGGGDGETPIVDKAELVEYLKHLIAQAATFCAERGVDTEPIKAARGFEKIALLDAAVEALIESEDSKKDYMGLARNICRVFRAILPDPSANEVTPDAVLFSVLAQKIKALTPPVDISHVMAQVEDLLDRSVAPLPYVMPSEPVEPFLDLSRIDFDKLKEKFDQGKKRTETERLRALLNRKLQAMVARNPSRRDFLERFRQLIEAYNAGSKNIETIFSELLQLTKDLNEEQQRAMREGLSEEELALFDILTKPEPELSDKEKERVKKICKSLLETLKTEKLVLDWRMKPQARGAVRQAIEAFLDEGLPKAYDEPIFNAKCHAAYMHVYDNYYGAGQSLYAASP
jgi:type I restriction enzyme R subunit